MTPSAQVPVTIPPPQMPSFAAPAQISTILPRPQTSTTNNIWSPANEVEPENILPQLIGDANKEIPSSPSSCSSASSLSSTEVMTVLNRQTSLIESQARAIRCLEKKVQEQSDILASTNIILENLVTLSTRPTGGQENKDRRSPVKPSSRPAKIPRREERRDDRVRSVLGKSYTNTRVNYNNRR